MTDVTAPSNSTESLRLLYQLSTELAKSLDLQISIEQILTLITQYLDCDRGSLVVLSEGEPIEAALMYEGRIMFNNVPQFSDIIKQGLISWVIDNMEPAFVNNTVIDPRWLKRIDDSPEQTGAKSAMCLPLISGETLVGVLTVVHPGEDTFSPEQFEFAKIAVHQVASGIYNSLRCSLMNNAQLHYYELFKDHVNPMLVTASNGEILEVNRAMCELLQVKEDKLVEKSIYDLHQAPFHILGDGFDDLITGGVEQYEATLHPKDGGVITARIYVRMLPHDATGQLMWVFEDITSERELENMRRDMISMIYHDIRSPLANVISSLELLKVMMPEYEDENIDEVLNVISRSTNRVQRLASDLLDIDRLEQEQNLLDMIDMDVQDLVENVASTIQPTLVTRYQKLSTEVNSNIEDVWADEDMLKRILINLLENASKYSPADTMISLKVEKDFGKALRFSVKDQGAGIPKNQLETIFDKFTRVDHPNGPKGIGLGLAYCKLAVEAHHGRIWAESDGENGTSFIFVLPNQPPKPAVSPFET